MKMERFWRYLISVLVVLSLLLNVYLLVTLTQIGRGLHTAAESGREALADVLGEPAAITVAVNQQIPISMTIPFSDTFVVPVVFDFPLSTRVATYVNIPVLGRQEIVVPVEATIPVSQTFEVPISRAIPISLTYVLQADIPVEVEIPPDVATSLDGFIDGFEQALRPQLLPRQP